MSTTVTKSDNTAELYQVRQERNFEGWADIVLLCGKTSVSVLVRSDYGDYSYHWRATGDSPKQFLIDCDFDYLMKNLSNGELRVLDQQANEKAIKQAITKKRREDSLTELEAREAFESMPPLAYENNEQLYFHLMYHSEHFDAVFGEYDYIPDQKRYCYQCEAFWKHVWLPFTDHLKAELAEKKEIKEGA